MIGRLEALKNARNKIELAELISVSPVFLTHLLYVVKTENLYSNFDIPKKSGGSREIYAPEQKLKDLQKKLSNLLLDCLEEIRTKDNISTTISHGFERNKTILTNAEKHKKRNLVLNMDLENFFDSFNFGRVRGFFIKNKKFSLNEEVATVIAQISCFNNKLPQGSPCSPVITNLISSSLDMRLNKLAKKNKCTYTRYADDITFSTNKSLLGNDIIKNISSTTNIILGSALVKEIEKSGFKINNKKTRLQLMRSRQDVTGLIVNKMINTKNEYHKKIRAMCNNLFKYGEFTLIDKKTHEKRNGKLEELEGMLSFIDHIDKYNNIQRKKNKKIQKKLTGKSKKTIPLKREEKLNKREMVYSDFIYFRKFHANEKATIITEGHTDIIHIKCALIALNHKYPTLIQNDNNKYIFNLNFFRTTTKTKWLLDFSGGADPIKKFIENYENNYKKYPCFKAKNPVIIILDNDSGTKSIVSYLAKNGEFNCTREELSNGSYTHIYENLFVIFTPKNNDNDSSIEDFYEDDVLNKELNKKKFNRTNNECDDTQYGKNYFANFIIKQNKNHINFENFSILLNEINKIISIYESNDT